MKRLLKDILKDLSYGPMAGLWAGKELSGNIPDSSQSRVMWLISAALEDMHTRMILKEKMITLRVFDLKTRYPLRSEHSWNAASGEFGQNRAWILDTDSDPFQDDIVKILRVYDAEGKPVPLNDASELDAEGNLIGVFTPEDDVVEIPSPASGDFYQIVYQAGHPLKSEMSEADEINLPSALYPAIPLYVAGRIFSSMNGSEHVARAAELLGEYEAVLERVQRLDLANTSILEPNTKLNDRGFM